MSREREAALFCILFENFTKTPASECCCDPCMTHVNEQLAAETLRSSSTKRPDGPWENQFPCIWSAHVCVFLLQGCIYTMCFLSLSPALIGNALTSDRCGSCKRNFRLLCLSVCVWRLKVKCASFPHKWVCMGPLQDGLHSHTQIFQLLRHIFPTYFRPCSPAVTYSYTRFNQCTSRNGLRFLIAVSCPRLITVKPHCNCSWRPWQAMFI